MSNSHEEFLQRLVDEVDRMVDEYCPEDLTPDDIQVNIKVTQGKHPLGENIRLLGSSIMIKLETIKYDTPSLNPGQRGISRNDKFLGFDALWVNVEHLSAVYPGKTIEIEGSYVKTCFVSLMEENVYRIVGTCEDFFESVQTPLVEFAAAAEGLQKKSVTAHSGHLSGECECKEIDENG
jgi:hypothetical protein